MSSDCSRVSIPLSVYVSLFARPLTVPAISAFVSLTPVRLLAAFHLFYFLPSLCLFYLRSSSSLHLPVLCVSQSQWYLVLPIYQSFSSFAIFGEFNYLNSHATGAAAATSS